MLRHGAALWHLWLFGAVAAPLGLWLWHGQGPHFGLGQAKGEVSRGAAIGCAIALAALVALGLIIGE